MVLTTTTSSITNIHKVLKLTHKSRRLVQQLSKLASYCQIFIRFAGYILAFQRFLKTLIGTLNFQKRDVAITRSINTTIEAFFKLFCEGTLQQDEDAWAGPIFAPECLIRCSRGADHEAVFFPNQQYDKRGPSGTISTSVEILDKTIDAATRKAWLLMKHDVQSHGKKKTMECVWIMSFSQDGTQVKGYRQFVDTYTCKQFITASSKTTRPRNDGAGSFTDYERWRAGGGKKGR